MERPTGVTLISVLAFIGAGILVLAGLGTFLGGAIVSTMASRPGLGVMAGIGGAFVGIVFLAIAAVDVILGVGLWKLRDWARIITVVLVIIGAVLNGFGLLRSMLHFRVISLFMQAIFVAIDIWIAVYLSQANVKQAFATRPAVASTAS